MRFRTLADDARAILNTGIWHGRLARVLSHWQSLALGDTLPRYGQLKLSSLAPDLRFLASLEVAGPDCCFISVGDEIAERFGRHLVGTYLADQMVGPAQLDVLAAHRACIGERKPVASEIRLDSVDLSNRLPYQRLLLPFAETDSPVDHILWVMAFPG